MKRHLLLFCALIYSFSIIYAQNNVHIVPVGNDFEETTAPAPAVNVVFNGQSLNSYQGQTITFNQTLYVCGRSSYNSNVLLLSYERIRQAKEVAIEGTAEYDAMMDRNSNAFLTATFSNLLSDTIRTGATLTNLTARVTGAKSVQVSANQSFGSNIRPTSRPDVGDARLIVCAANVEYYCPDWEGTYSNATSDEDYQRQHANLMKAFQNIGADIFALTEIQNGAAALRNITNGLNALTAPGRYAYVDDGDTTVNSYTKVGFVYRTDKVTPVLALGRPYTSITYRKREYVQAFQELESGERFVLSMNHFKAQEGADDTTTNSIRMQNAERLVEFLESKLRSNYYQDSDILIVGDLNCSTMAEPIRYLVSSGYANQLSVYAPTEYSYVFNNEVEYLDHVLASATLAPQITGVAPYHINADESWRFYYPYGDTTMYRYADHDPIIIGLRLFTEIDTNCTAIRYMEDFSTDLGLFTTADNAGSTNWYHYHNSGLNLDCAYMNGYNAGSSDDWLISPSFDMTGRDSAVVGFQHTLGYGTPDTWAQVCQMKVSKDFAGDPTQATWETLAIPNMPASNWSWEFNEIALPESYNGEPSVVVAFHYLASSTDAPPAWEIKDFTFTAQCVDEDDDDDNGGDNGDDHPGIPSHSQRANSKVYSVGNQIVVENQRPANVVVYDAMGRALHRQNNATRCAIRVPSGLYIVRTGSEVVKVLVK